MSKPANGYKSKISRVCIAVCMRIFYVIFISNICYDDLTKRLDWIL